MDDRFADAVVVRRKQGWNTNVAPKVGGSAREKILECEVTEPSTLTFTVQTATGAIDGFWTVETLVGGAARFRTFLGVIQGLALACPQGRTSVYVEGAEVQSYLLRVELAKGAPVLEHLGETVTLGPAAVLVLFPPAYARFVRVYGFESPGVITAQTVASTAALCALGVPVVAHAAELTLTNTGPANAAVTVEWEIVA